MKKFYSNIVGICALVLCSNILLGQAFSNTTMVVSYLDNTGTLSTLTSPTTLLSTGQDDVASSVTNIGFDFYMNGTKYTQFSASSNGVMGLGGTAVTTSGTTNSLASAGPLISPYWNDLNTGSNGYVKSELQGTAPNRSLVVEWKVNEHSVGGSSGSAPYIFQVRIFETTNVIWFTNSVATPASAASSGYSYGISTSSTNYVNVNNATPPTISWNTGVNNTQTSSVVAGRRIIFTPSAQPTDPSGMSCTVNSSSQITVNWTDNASNELGYELYYSTNSAVPLDGTNSTLVSKAAGSTSHVVTGLCVGTQYYFKVFARKEGLSGAATTTCTTTGTCTPPTTQASSVASASVLSSTATVSWTRGNGANVLVVGYPGATAGTVPVNGTTYTANAAYGTGTALGTGRVVYSGTGTSVALTSLVSGTQYTFVAYEFSTSCSSNCYNAATTGSTTLTTFAQGSASCATLNKLCTNVGQTLTFGATVSAADASVTNPGNSYGCLISSPRPTWFYVQMATSGSINITLQGYSNTNSVVDNDYILYGPFANLAAASSACNAYTVGQTVDCSYASGTGSEAIDIPVTATAGQVYVLLVTAYSASSSHFTLVQTGGTGSTECSGVSGACDVSSITVTPTTCTAGLYDVSGTVTFANPPSAAGSLYIRVDGVLKQTIAKPGGGWGASIGYSATGLTADGASHTVQADFQAISTCLGTQAYTSPAACSSCSAGNMTLTITPNN